MSKDNKGISNRSLIGGLLAVVGVSFAFGFALVPLYDVFCEITGFGGRTNREAVNVAEAPDLDREIRVEFVTTLNSYAQFEFTPDVRSMTVNPGKMYYATFTAKNLTGRDTVAQAVPSVTPNAASGHFIKIECFCFESQEFMVDEGRPLPLQFYVDPDLPEYVDTITLQYTLFDNSRTTASNQL